MLKTLVKHGNSYALVIDKPILELLHVTPDTPLELATNGLTLMISPVRDAARQRKLRQSLEKMNRKYGDDLKRLAKEEKFDQSIRKVHKRFGRAMQQLAK